ncbi:lipoprotein insertase outer membrane protein LolB [Shewanella sp. WXL01]|uniref:lipoprotein insertase outer membrane protein LolB n=1 Tax=Shewanella sp. WXL01 TaxID=2709721 RepID=UPI0032AF3502
MNTQKPQAITVRQFSFISLLLLLMLMLNGCSSLKHTNFEPVSVNHVAQAQHWELKGKIAVRSNTDKFSTNLYWFHQAQGDDLRLTTMIGTNLLVLDSGPQGATLTANGETYFDKDPQTLLDSMVSIHIPLDRLPLWITGQASSEDKIVSYNADGTIKQLISEQTASHWQVDFRSWQILQGIQIPRQIIIVRDDVQIKIQNNQWQAMQPIK